MAAENVKGWQQDCLFHLFFNASGRDKVYSCSKCVVRFCEEKRRIN